MNIKILVLPVVVGASVYASSSLLYQGGSPKEPVTQAAAIPTRASDNSLVVVAAEAAPTSQTPLPDKGAEKPANRPARTLNREGRLEPASETSSKNSVSNQPAKNPIAAASPVLLRWKVPALEVPKNQFFFQRMASVAINNDGTRVIAQNHPFVDFWDTRTISNVRQCPLPYWDISGGAIVAQDASRAYIWNTDAKKVETYNEKGVRVGSIPQLGFGLELRRLGYDFSPRDIALGTRLYDASTPASARRPQSPGEGGIFQFDPDTGALKNVIFMKDIWDVNEAKQVLRLPNGQFLALYYGHREGLHKIDKDETITKIADIPSKDMKGITDIASSPDGRYVSFRNSQRLEVWDITANKRVLDWRKEHRHARACRFTGDGNLVILSIQTNIKDVATSNLTGGWVPKTLRMEMLAIPSLRVMGELNLADFDLPSEAFAFSPNGKRMVLSDWKQVAVIDPARAFPGK